MAIQSPLSDTDFDEIKQNLERLSDVDKELKLAERAGIDVTAQKAALQKSRQQLIKLKQTYFPNRQ